MRVSALAAAVAAVILTFVLFSPAVADNWGSGVWAAPTISCLNGDYRSECTADNSSHTVYIYTTADGCGICAVPSRFAMWIEDSLDEDYDITIGGTVQFTGTRVLNFTSATDVYVIGTIIPGSIPNWLYTTCGSGSEHGGGTGEYEWCEPQAFRIDPVRADADGNCLTTDNCMRRLACHEIGHTTGLQHLGASPNPNSNTRESCLEYKEGDGNNPHNLDDHDREHLAECYPRPGGAPATRTPICRN